MSVEVIVYLRDADLPTRDAWQRSIDEAGISLRLDEFSPREHTGFLPAALDGQDAGFEYYFEPVEPSESEEIGEEIADRDCMASFVWHSSEIEGRSAMLAAAVLTKLADGVFYDPQSGEFARGDDVFRLLEEEEQSERERLMQLAETKWGQTTTRRCPQCNAPCPEYKAKCAVCDYAIGRA